MARAAGKRHAAVKLGRVARHRIQVKAEVSNPRGERQARAGRVVDRRVMESSPAAVRPWSVALKANVHAEIAAVAKARVAMRYRAMP